MLRADNITFGYVKNKPIIESLSLAIGPTERVALTAPSGFGKTTLCRLLSGYERPWEGRVEVDGQPLANRGACQVQLVGQHPETVFDPRLSLARSLSEAGEVEPRLLEALGIRDIWLPRRPHELSGGELQRFCIARALMVHPSYLIADEISTMLDAVTQALIWRYLLEWAERESMGLLFVSHSPALVKRIATRVVSLSGLLSAHDQRAAMS